MTKLVLQSFPRPSEITPSLIRSAALPPTFVDDNLNGQPAQWPVERLKDRKNLVSVSFDKACSLCPAHKSLCGGLANEDNASFTIKGASHTVPARRLILHPKEWSEHVSIICSGWAMSSISLPDGRRQIISFLLPGDIVSINNVVAPSTGYTVESITPVTYRNFSRDDLRKLLFGHADLAETFLKILIEYKVASDNLAVHLGRSRAEERIARLILRLSEKVASRSTVREQSFDFPLRHWHIADATGMTPVNVSKVMGRLQETGIIGLDHRTLTIFHATELQKIANCG